LSDVKVDDAIQGANLVYDVTQEDGSKTTWEQTFVDANTYYLRASLPASKSRQRQATSWNITFYRVHGSYLSQDLEGSVDKSICNFGGSSLYGHNVEAEGTITVGKKVYTISRTSRYRGYAAGSWGCDLPQGKPPVDYPW
jgi:hypothetical protein